MDTIPDNKKEDTTKNDLYQKFSEKLKNKKSAQLQAKLYKCIYYLLFG